MELGVIKGRVVDEAGKPIPGVTIRLVNVDRGREVTITTDKDGRFYRRGLQVGGYELKVEHEGYQPVSNTDQDLRRHRQQLRLHAGQGAQRPARRSSRRASPPSTPSDFATAATKFEAAVAQSPTVAPLYVNLALAYFQLKRPAEAVASLEKAAALAPGRRRASSSSSAAPTSTRRPTTRRWWRSRRAWPSHPDLAKDPLVAEAASTLGAVYFAQGKIAEAEAQFQKVLAAQARPRRGDARHGQGRIQQGRRGQGARAVRAGRDGASGNARRPRRPRPSSKSSRRAIRQEVML